MKPYTKNPLCPNCGWDIRPSFTQINWNDQVTIEPNDYGWILWKEYWQRFGLKPPESDGKTLTLSLWEAASIFGKDLSLGFEVPFKTMYMKYHKKR